LLHPSNAQPHDAESEVDFWARLLLRRYGVVFRRLLVRETSTPPWRDLVRHYWRLEARGEIRGGRFVTGFAGEQFALPEALGALRKIRKEPADEAFVFVNGADPLNLAGILTPGERVPAIASNRIAFRVGVPAFVLEGGKIRSLEMGTEIPYEAQKAIRRRSVPPELNVFVK
jgi:ATP-dependent Lhr-like helicase